MQPNQSDNASPGASENLASGRNSPAKQHRTESDAAVGSLPQVDATARSSVPPFPAGDLLDHAESIRAAVMERFQEFLGARDIEIEARLCEIRGVPKSSTRVVSERHAIEVGVDRKTFSSVTRMLLDVERGSRSTSKSVDTRIGDVRLTLNQGTVTAVRKSRRAVLDVLLAGCRYDLRFAASSEVPCDALPFPDPVPRDARKKERTSLRVDDVTYDLTVVESRGSVGREIEIEMSCTSPEDLCKLVDHALGLAAATS
jgi:hypothetical protein